MTKRPRQQHHPLSIAQHLLAWYATHRRRLPWRESPSPYKTLISEFMLQQTTVATVLPYFARFIRTFPSLAALARAPESAVLAAWSGLGYYTRARNLHRAAVAISRDHEGRIPTDEAALRSLPGIGPYTAAAIAAIAFDQRAFAVDGNSARVMARLAAIRADVRAPDVRLRIKALGEEASPIRRAGDFMQAVMELGALVCTPRSPSCADCPIRCSCAAAARGLTTSIPRIAPKPTRRIVLVACVALQDPGSATPRFIVVRRAPGELLAGTWSLPEAELAASDDRVAAARKALARFSLTAVALEPLGEVRQLFTHRDVTAFVFGAHTKTAPRLSSQDISWASPDALANLAISSFARKTIRLATSEPSTSRDPQTKRRRTTERRATLPKRNTDSTLEPRST